MDGLKYEVENHLQVSCYKCTRQEKIRGESEEQAAKRAEMLGWREVRINGHLLGMVCRHCPGGGTLNREALYIEAAEEDMKAA